MNSKVLRKRVPVFLTAAVAVLLAIAIMLSGAPWSVRAASVLSEADAAEKLDAYNVVWNEQSKNSSESMPVGGGDVGCNVWTENNSLYLYIGKSDAYDENNEFLKLGRLKVDFGVTNVSAYRQELVLRDGYVKAELTTDKGRISADIWVDVETSTVNIDVTSDQPISLTAEYQTWRYEDKTYNTSGNFPSQNAMNDYIGYQGEVTKYADTVAFEGDTVLFYHQNREENVNDLLIAHQKLADVAGRIWDPLDGRIFGGVLAADGLAPNADVDGNKMTEGEYNDYPYKGYPLVASSPKSAQSLQVYVHTGIYETFGAWAAALNAKMEAYDHDAAKEASRNWWHDYFAKSYIIINPDAGPSDTAWQVGRNYNLFRYMLGCNANGTLPSKFNGGMFTFDPQNEKIGYYEPLQSGYGDPDFRLWGGGTQTQQNQRLLYWAMMKSGDFDIMPQALDTYVKASKTAEALTWNYYGHGGSMFTEQVNFNGLPSGNHYTWNRNNHGPWSNWDLGATGEEYTRFQYNTELEWAKMMLDLHRYTGQPVSDEYLGFVESVLTFFQEHYRAMYRALTGSASGYDEDGMLVIYPSASMETYKNIVNPIEVTVGLKSVISELLEIAEENPALYADKVDTARWEDLYDRIADPLVAEYNGLDMIMPGTDPGDLDRFYTGSDKAGKFYELNIEKPQLYTLFPFELYGLGTEKETLDIVRNTQLYFEDSGDEGWSKNGYISWHHNAVQAARLGDVANAEYFTVRKLADSSTLKFPAFWGPGHDWIPDHNWGASGMIGLQEMLLQCDADGTIRPFAATPDDWNVYFKLYAYGDTVVEGSKQGSDVEAKITVGEDSARSSVKVNVAGGFENVKVSEDGALLSTQVEALEDVNKQAGNLISFPVAKGKTYELTGIKYVAAYAGADAFSYDFRDEDSAEALKDGVRSDRPAVANENGGSITYAADGVTLTGGAYLTVPASAETNWWNDVTYKLSFKVNALPAEETRIFDLNPAGIDANAWLSVDANGKLRFGYAGTVQETAEGYVTAGGEYNVRFTYGTDFYMLSVNGNVIKTYRTGRASPLPMLSGATLTGGAGNVTFTRFSASRISETDVSSDAVTFVKVVDAPSDKIITATNKEGKEIRTLEHVTGPSEIRVSDGLQTVTGDGIGGIGFGYEGGAISVDNPAYGTKLKDFGLEVEVHIDAYLNKRMTIFNWSDNGWPTNGISLYMWGDGVLKLVNNYDEHSTGVKVPLGRWVKIGLMYSKTQGSYTVTLDGAPVYISHNLFSLTDKMATTEAITFGSRYAGKDNDYQFMGSMKNIAVYLDKEAANEYTKYFDFPLVSGDTITHTTDGVEVEGDVYEAKNAPVQNGADRGLYFGGGNSKIILDTEAFRSLSANEKIPDTFTVTMQIYVTAYGDNMTLFFWGGNDYDENGNGVNGMGMYLTDDGKVRVSFRKVTALSDDTVSLNTWTTLRLVYTGASNGETDYFKLYIDDTEQRGMRFDAVSSVSSNFWRYAPQLGRTWSGGRAFVGFIDDFELRVDEKSVSEPLTSITGDKTGSANVTGEVYEAAKRPNEETASTLPQEGLYFSGDESKIEIENPGYHKNDEFAIELSVYIEAYGANDMALFFWGGSNTWPVDGLMLAVTNNGQFKLAYNYEEAKSAAGAMPLKKWATIRLAFVGGSTDYFELYVDDGQVALSGLKTDEQLHDNVENDKIVLGRTTNGGDKKEFKGYLKDVKFTADTQEIALGNTVAALGDKAAQTGVIDASAVQTGESSGTDEGLYFKGKDGMVTLARPNGAALPARFTIGFSVFVTDYGSGDMAFFYWGDGESAWGFHGFFVGITSGGELKLGAHENESKGGKLPKNAWTAIQIVFDGAAGKISVYMNGTSSALCEISVSESDLSDLTAYDPVLGRTTNNGGDKKPFKGFLKDFSMEAQTLPVTALAMDKIVESGGAENDLAGNVTAAFTGVTEDKTVGGYKFDGQTSKIEIENPGYHKNDGFAIELSVYIEAYGENDMTLFFWGGSNTWPVDGIMLAVTKEGKFKLAYNWDEAYSAEAVLPLKKWTTVRLVFVGGSTDYFELYVDGEQVALSGLKADEQLHSNVESDKIVLGRTANGGDAKAFIGNMKDVRFYNGVSLKDVKDNYYEGKEGR